MSKPTIDDVVYQSLNSILSSAVVELANLRQAVLPGPARGNITDYLHTFVILRRSAQALLKEARENSDE